MRRHRERGAVLVESALLLPILVTILLGIIDGGFLMRDSNLVTRASQAAARTASSEADSRFTDYSALRGVDATVASLDSAAVERVIVYNAGVAGALDACKAAAFSDTVAPKGVAGTCNIYGAKQIAEDDPIEGFGTPGICGASDWDSNWCPTGRSRDPVAPTRVGVYVEARFGGVTSIFPSDVTIRRHAIFVLEPCVSASC